MTDAAIAAARPKAVAASRSRDRKSALLLAAPAALVLIALYAVPLAHLIVGSFVGAVGFQRHGL